MGTRFVGIKEFRQNIAKLANRSRRQDERLIILRNNQPILEVRPLSKKSATLEGLNRDISEALADVKSGRVYTHEQIMNMFGLR